MIATMEFIMVRAFPIAMITVILCAPFIALAQSSSVSITPVVIDQKGKLRDILKESIHITNTSDHVIDLYPRVDDIDIDTGGEAFVRAHGSDELSRSFANWIELSRGVITLTPGEERDVPFIVRIHPGAASGIYHARIAFSSGGTRDEAERRAPTAEVTINLEVQEDVKEILQINSFSSDSIVFTGDDVLFKYQLQNIGNSDEKPGGEIRIYDRKGHEVASVDVNREGKIVSPDQTSQLASAWSAVQGFGKFKAMITVKYGRSQTASVQDTAYFWVIPWKQLAAMIIGGVIAALLLAFYFHRWLEERHFGKLAAAGLLKAEALIHMPHLQQHVPHALMPQVSSSPSGAAVAVVERRWKRWLKKVGSLFALIFAILLHLFSHLMSWRKKFTSIRTGVPMRANVLAAPAAPVAQVVPAHPAPSAASGTINLKHMHAAPKHDEWNVQVHAPRSSDQSGSVINLKNSS